MENGYAGRLGHRGFQHCQADVYGDPPLSGSVHLDADYVERAKKDVALRISRAGVRLAAVLNKAFGK